MDSRMMVSQNITPGSADFHALWMILFHKARASTSLVYFGLGESMGYCWMKGLFSLTHCMNSSVRRTEMLALVMRPCVILASIKASESGCLMLMVIIKAPRRPSWATSLVELEKRSMKGTTPVEVRAQFFTGLPAGRRCDKS